MRRIRFSALFIGLNWLAISTGCQIFEDAASKHDPYKFQGNFFISVSASKPEIRMDSPFKVLWSTQEVQASGRVSVFLTSDSGDLLLAENIPDTGGLLVQIGERHLPNSDAFRVKVVDAEKPDRMDYSMLFSIFPIHKSRLYFRNFLAGTTLKLDSSYTFEVEPPTGPLQDFNMFLLQNDSPVAVVTSSLNGSELFIQLSGQGAGSGNNFRFLVSGIQRSDVPEPYYGISAPFSITSNYYGGIDFYKPSPLDTLIAGSVDTLTYTQHGNLGVTLISGIYIDSVFFRPITIGNRFELGDTQKIVWTIPFGLQTGSKFRIGITSSSDPNLPVSLSSPFIVLGLDPDAYEYDNEAAFAKELRVKEAPQEHTLPDGDTDWIWFNGEAGHSYAIRSRGLGYSVRAVRQDTNEFPLQTLTNGYNEDISIGIFQPEKTGRYQLKIGPERWAQLENGFIYSISLHSVQFDSTGLWVGFSAPLPGSRIAAGRLTPINWNPDTLLFSNDVRLELYRDSTKVQTLTNTTPNSGEFNWMVDSFSLTSSKYRIKISQSNAPGLFGFSQSFTIEGQTPDAYEPDNIRSLAKRILPGGVVQGHSLLVSDTDWVTFDCTPDRSYGVEVKSEFPLVLNVFAGPQYTTGGKSPKISDIVGVGECFIRLESYQSRLGDYILSVSTSMP